MEDLPDSTDWIKTSLPAFEPLEASLRCEVCKEFYESPVITTCSHTFCSLCIRRCITNDGKCPACKSAIQAERLVANHAVREIVNRFQVARPKALELARQINDDAQVVDASGASKKRKIEDTDIEGETHVRQTRSRITRSSSRRGDGVSYSLVVVPDSEDEVVDEEKGDEEYNPDDMSACPICLKRMKAVLVFDHVPVCPGEGKSDGGHSIRSKTNNSSNFLQRERKTESPAPSRLPGLNFSLLSETNLRKKLKELGIPSSGKKDLMMRRHTEWLHLWNSNCDASEDRRKSKRELLRELDTWERIHGGNASVAESKVMQKDYDAKAHASAHKSQFDDLIANARKKRAAPKVDEKKDDTPQNEAMEIDEQMNGAGESRTNPELQTSLEHSIDPLRPYEGNEAALATIREKVEQMNHGGSNVPSLSREASSISKLSVSSPDLPDTQVGLRDPFGSPSRKVPMFRVPEEPVVDVERSTSVQ